MNELTQKFKKFSVQTLLETWPDLIKTESELNAHQLKTELYQVSSGQDPKKNSIIFISDPITSLPESILKQPPAAVVLSLNCSPKTLIEMKELEIIPLLSPNPKLAMSLVSEAHFTSPRIESHFQFSDQNIHPTAIIHPTTKLGQGVKVGPYAVIGAHCNIGDFSKIASHVVIEDEVTLGDFCQIHAHVMLAWGTLMGTHCVVQSQSCIGSDGFGYATDQRGQHFGIPHLGQVKFGNHVHIGAGTQIDRGTYGETSIDDFTKIDNLVHIAHNCEIGKSCLITAGFMVAGSTKIGNFFVAGGGSVVTGHINICDQVQVAGVSVVHKSITKPGKYGGYPLVPLNEHLKILASSGKILELRHELNRVLKFLKLNKE